MNSELLYHTAKHTLPAALALLPGRMDSPNARAEILTIGLQESDGMSARVQYGGGPAHGLWQFEKNGGVKVVLTHPETGIIILPILKILNYPASIAECYAAITHNDVLACVFARLLLWSVPGALPQPHEAEKGWQQYLSAWRPGKPHRQTWDGFYTEAWRTVLEE